VSEVFYSANIFSPALHGEMDVLKEHHFCINFCWKLGKTVTEKYEMLQKACRETALGQSKIFE
jgi:hypothetical protein